MKGGGGGKERDVESLDLEFEFYVCFLPIFVVSIYKNSHI